MDDEDFIRDIASEILEFMGYEVESCADGKEAVERFRNARESKVSYDAVVLDLTIPGDMGGKEACLLLLIGRSGRKLPLCSFSGLFEIAAIWVPAKASGTYNESIIASESGI